MKIKTEPELRILSLEKVVMGALPFGSIVYEPGDIKYSLTCMRPLYYHHMLSIAISIFR